MNERGLALNMPPSFLFCTPKIYTMRFPLIFLCLATAITFYSSAQNEVTQLDNLRHHVYALADDSLGGRPTGKQGEMMAANYIVRNFEEIGIEPYGADNSFLQPFEFFSHKKPVGANNLRFGSQKLAMKTGYFPLPNSGNGKIEGLLADVNYGIHAPDLEHDDYKGKTDLEGKIFLMKWASPDGDDFHSDFTKYSDATTKVDGAIERGAIGVIFYNPFESVKSPKMDLTKKVAESDIPVIFLNAAKTVSILKKDKNTTISLNVNLEKVNLTGHNVIGFLNNKAKRTIVIGGHYDHLGHGESGGTLHRGKPDIHNGADDNASGIALIIEAARSLKAGKATKNNYLFIAFSGEELGLYGSNHYCKNPTVKISSTNYMLNYDMVGRLDTTDMALAINGAGTSPAWQNAFAKIDSEFKIKTSESGIGPSDHTSFYLQDIPAVHFFTGSHNDYHKPGDDADKVNYEGIQMILTYTLNLIELLNDKGKLKFTKTKEEEKDAVPRFTVTLGVVPDYMYDGDGMRIDGVTDGKTASKAGIKAGDVVIKMGDLVVKDMMSYMKGLSLFTSGDETIVVVQRGEKEISFEVKFQ